MNRVLHFLKNQIGPGIIYAGAAIGVSHIIQSIRAGEKYGFLFILVTIFIHIIKYPFFYFATKYTLITRENIIQGYFKIGKFYGRFFLIFTILTMFILLSALLLTTNSILFNLLQIQVSSLSLNILNVFILCICCAFLYFGKYKLLDRGMKFILASLFLLTCFVFVASFETTNFSLQQQFSMGWGDVSLVFLIAFMGWMPAPMDVAVWNSLWTEEKMKKDKEFDMKRV